MTSLGDELRADAGLRCAHAAFTAGGADRVRVDRLVFGSVRAIGAVLVALVASARGADPIRLPAPGVDDVLTEPRP